MVFSVARTILLKSTKRDCGFRNYARAWNILFFGTDDCAVASLKQLQSGKPHLVNSLEVVTSNKKMNSAQKYAKDQNLTHHTWPIDVPIGKFDVGIVSSFGNLIPENIISAFPWGMINVHPSLLPRWRGAAPVNHTILNGDTVSGVTIMTIEPKYFDRGNILMQESHPVTQDITAKDLTKELAGLGAQLLMKCLEDLPENLRKSIPQNSMQLGVTQAPKISPKMAVIDWNQQCSQIYCQYRALTGYYELETYLDNKLIKLGKMMSPSFIQSLRIEELFEKYFESQSAVAGSIFLHKKRNILCVRCQDQWVGFQSVLVKGYKWINPLQFYSGFLTKIPSTEWTFGEKRSF